MKIVKIEKDAKGYHLTSQSGEVYFLTEEGFYPLGIREGDEITDLVFFKEALEKDRFRYLKHRAMSYLNSGSKTKQQLRIKFKAENYTSEEIEKLIQFLEGYDLLKESAFLESSVRRLQEKGVSRMKAQHTLKQKGFEDEMTQVCLEGWNGEMEEEHARKLARKKWKSIKGDTNEKKMEKLIRFLSSRGFQWNSISAALRMISEEENQEFYEE